MVKPPLERSYQCAHSDDQRILTGTWCTPELNKAIELGYEIQYIYEVWHFPETQEGLFKDYVNTWLKIKQEASGWPDWVGDDETKRQRYIHDYHQNEGILLEYPKIEYNPGLRALAKMMLNSMWGKFGQRLNKTQVQDFDDPQKFHNFLDSDARDVKHVSVVNDNIVEVHYQLQDDSPPVGRGSVFTKPSNSWVSGCSTSTPTRSSISRNRDNPTRLWETTSASSPAN